MDPHALEIADYVVIALTAALGAGAVPPLAVKVGGVLLAATRAVIARARAPRPPDVDPELEKLRLVVVDVERQVGELREANGRLQAALEGRTAVGRLRSSRSRSNVVPP